jgi:hypothetical protein
MSAATLELQPRFAPEQRPPQLREFDEIDQDEDEDVDFEDVDLEDVDLDEDHEEDDDA